MDAFSALVGFVAGISTPILLSGAFVLLMTWTMGRGCSVPGLRWVFLIAIPGVAMMTWGIPAVAFNNMLIGAAAYIAVGAVFSVFKALRAIRAAADWHREKWGSFVAGNLQVSMKLTHPLIKRPELFKRTFPMVAAVQAAFTGTWIPCNTGVKDAGVDDPIQTPDSVDSETDEVNRNNMSKAVMEAVRIDYIYKRVSCEQSSWDDRRIVGITAVSEPLGAQSLVTPTVIRKRLAEWIGSWITFWPFYALSFVFDDMLAAFCKQIADAVAALSNKLVQRWFSDVFKNGV